ncbi:hypothetical protein F7018_01325 [Tenacibaculum aiptasiae]|uniref:Uncharacterized protein n=1 Tax=Tenacibaculum aiptasiae TaxID=426481 RepID=A0A7J5ASD6_9FLAO|nr:hypothetical protein [Tenacibaculum aiptasiae]KAB1160545.1 hypothetical protein F7018_01325 [Tenacibaculum aiptasiae]
MKKNLLTLIFTLFYLFTYSQNCIKKGKIEDLKQLTKRPLAVVVYKENEGYIKKLQKKIAKNNKKKAKYEKELKAYRNHITYFNKTVKQVVTDYWKLNSTENIQYFTKSQLENLTKEKSNSYAVLDLTMDVVMADFNSLFTLNIYVITYGGSEKNRNKAIYKNHLTNINYNIPNHADKALKKSIESLKTERENGPLYLSKENMITSLSLSQKYLKKVLELGKRISFEDFAEEEMKNNCKSLEGSTILFQEAIVHGKIKKDLTSLLPKAKITLVSANRIAKAIENKENVLIGFPVTKKFVKQKGFGAIAVIPVSHKMIMNAKTKEIVGFVPHSGITSYSYFKKKDFKKLNKQCN